MKLWLFSALFVCFALNSVALGADEEKKRPERGGQARPGADGILQLLRDPEAAFKKMSDGKDTVGKDQFVKYVTDQIPQAGRLKDNPQIIERMFDFLDKDGDGKLTQDEVKKSKEGLQDRIKNVDPEKLKDLRERFQNRGKGSGSDK